MIELKYTCIGVRCSCCGRNVIEYINRFQLASGTDFVCPDCSFKVASIKKKNNCSNILLNCFACGETHEYPIPAKNFFSEKAFSFCCKKNDVDVLYTGSYGDVENAMFQLSQEINRLTDKYYKNFEQLYGVCATSALRILEEKAQKKRIVCLCGSHIMNLKLCEGGIELICSRCGGTEFIPITTPEDIISLKERRSILIK